MDRSHQAIASSIKSQPSYVPDSSSKSMSGRATCPQPQPMSRMVLDGFMPANNLRYNTYSVAADSQIAGAPIDQRRCSGGCSCFPTIRRARASTGLQRYIKRRCLPNFMPITVKPSVVIGADGERNPGTDFRSRDWICRIKISENGAMRKESISHHSSTSCDGSRSRHEFLIFLSRHDAPVNSRTRVSL